jgi:DNA-binding NarL/FixJ family response regulator
MGRSAAKRADVADYIDALLIATAVPAFLVRGDGTVVRANSSGERALASRRDRTLRELRTGVTGHGVVRAYQARELRTDSGSRYLIVVATEVAPLDRTASCAQIWKLTRREREVLVQVAAGLSNKQIASALRIAEVTAENHLTKIFRKACVATRTALLALLLQHAGGSP